MLSDVKYRATALSLLQACPPRTAHLSLAVLFLITLYVHTTDLHGFDFVEQSGIIPYVFNNSPSIDDLIFTIINKTPVKYHYTYIGPWSCNCSLWSTVTQSDPVSNQAVVTDKSNARD